MISFCVKNVTNKLIVNPDLRADFLSLVAEFMGSEVHALLIDASTDLLNDFLPTLFDLFQDKQWVLVTSIVLLAFPVCAFDLDA